MHAAPAVSVVGGEAGEAGGGATSRAARSVEDGMRPFTTVPGGRMAAASAARVSISEAISTRRSDGVRRRQGRQRRRVAAYRGRYDRVAGDGVGSPGVGDGREGRGSLTYEWDGERIDCRERCVPPRSRLASALSSPFLLAAR